MWFKWEYLAPIRRAVAHLLGQFTANVPGISGGLVGSVSEPAADAPHQQFTLYLYFTDKKIKFHINTLIFLKTFFLLTLKRLFAIGLFVTFLMKMRLPPLPQPVLAPLSGRRFLVLRSSADTFWGKGFLATALGTASPDRKKTHRGQKEWTRGRVDVLGV